MTLPPGPRAPEPFSSATLGPLTLRNRVIKAATFEGQTPERLVTDELIAFHRRVAAGGVGMSTVAYCAVSPEGGTDGRQILLRDEAVTGLRRLTDAIHAEGAAAAAQLGHAGPVATEPKSPVKYWLLNTTCWTVNPNPRVTTARLTPRVRSAGMAKIVPTRIANTTPARNASSAGHCSWPTSRDANSAPSPADGVLRERELTRVPGEHDDRQDEDADDEGGVERPSTTWRRTRTR